MSDSIGSRIKALRKALKMTQTEFGERLSVSIDVIANIEHERLARPEQKEPLYKLICKEFNVRYEWLTSGEGEMFVVTKQSFVEKLSAEYGLSDTAQSIIECYLNLGDEQRAVVDNFIKSVAESISQSSDGNSGAVDAALDKSISGAASQDNDIAADIKNTIQQTEAAFQNVTRKK